MAQIKALASNSSENSKDDDTGFTLPPIGKIKGVKSEKRKSIKLNMDNPPSIKAKRNYMSLESDELEDRNIIGTRKTMAIVVQSNVVNIGIVVFIIAYCAITFIFTSIPPDNSNIVAVKATYHTIEFVFIVIFIIEIVISRYSFKELYFSNKFNLVNVILIVFIIIFLIIDIAVEDFTVSVLLRVRGVMRLFHVPVILESIKSHIKMQSMNSYKEVLIENRDKTTVEKVIEILISIGDSLEDPKLSSDVSY